MKKYDYYLNLEGLNFNRLFDNLNTHNITIFDYVRPNYKQCMFGVKAYDYYLIKKLKLLNEYKYNIVSRKNFGLCLYSIFHNFGIVIGLIISCVFCFVISRTTLKINVIGVENIKTSEIIDMLKSINVTTGKINTVSNQYIEQYLIKNNDKISLASVIKKGTNLIVNIKEKIVQAEVVDSICATSDMIVDYIKVVQGEAKVKVGDIVKKGDVLVAPRKIRQNDEEILLQPIAEISGTTWAVGQVEFDTEKIEYVRTDKKIVNSEYIINKWKIFSHTSRVKFETYEKKVYNEYVFKNMFIPLKLSRVIYYETKENVVQQNFEEHKNSLVDNSKKIAYANLPNWAKVNNETLAINNNNGHYYITTYLEYNTTIKG